MHRRGFLALGLAGASAGCLGRLPFAADEPTEGPRTIHVEAGASSWRADGTADAPMPTISSALERATPGDTVAVAPGEYRESIAPTRGGLPGEPITITGPPDAVVRASDDAYYPVLLQTSHVHLTGLSVDGLKDPDDPEELDAYAPSSLVQVRPVADTDEYVEDLVIAPHRIGNGRAALVNVERARNVEIGPFRVSGPAGTAYLLTDRQEHNGEVVYLGTSPTNLGSHSHPWTEYDRTSDVLVHHVDNAAGHHHSELVNTKLGTHDVTIEYCTDGGGSRNTEPWPPASVRFQSYAATVRWCDLRDGDGYGVEVAAYYADQRQREVDEADLTEAERRGGTDHSIYGNRVTGFEAGAFAFPASPVGQTPAVQRRFCGNDFEGSSPGDPGKSCGNDVPTGDGVGHTGGSSRRA